MGLDMKTPIVPGDGDTADDGELGIKKIFGVDAGKVEGWIL